MKIGHIVLCTVAAVALCAVAGAQTAPNTYWQKVMAGEPATIAFYGGSITYGAGASNRTKTSWAALIGDWLKGGSPDAPVKVVNASIGGTGSVFGAKRADRDLLPHRPDLVFIEFAVNDALGGVRFISKELTQGCLEVLIRQLKRANPGVTVIIVSTAFRDPKQQNEREMHKAVAAHYGLPVVDFKVRYDAGVADGAIKPEEFMSDYDGIRSRETEKTTSGRVSRDTARACGDKREPVSRLGRTPGMLIAVTPNRPTEQSPIFRPHAKACPFLLGSI